jgi:hypothetical protein
MLTASHIHYETSGRVRGLSHGGLGALPTLARQLGLIEAIDRRLHVLLNASAPIACLLVDNIRRFPRMLAENDIIGRVRVRGPR